MRIELAYPYTDADGKNHKADATVDLPVEEALSLVRDGIARKTTPTPADVAAKSAVKKES